MANSLTRIALMRLALKNPAYLAVSKVWRGLAPCSRFETDHGYHSHSLALMQRQVCKVIE